MTHEGAQTKRKRNAPDSQTELSHDDHDDDVATAAAQLQQRGWCALRSPPTWSPVAFCEAMHARWGARVVALLEAERPRWFISRGEAEAEAEAGGGGGGGGGSGVEGDVGTICQNRSLVPMHDPALV